MLPATRIKHLTRLSLYNDCGSGVTGGIPIGGTPANSDRFHLIVKNFKDSWSGVIFATVCQHTGEYLKYNYSTSEDYQKPTKDIEAKLDKFIARKVRRFA